MAKPRPIPGLTPEEPYALAAAKVVAVRAGELADHSREVLDVADIERLHDMRVATRRLRAALEVFEPCFPSDPYKRALGEVKEIADALGERRDRDVSIASLEEFSTVVAAPDRPGVSSLIASLRAEQRAANEALAPFVDRSRIAGLAELLTELVMAAEREGGGAEALATAAAPTIEGGGNGSRSDLDGDSAQ
jgi:CHAD domain-containing protein